MPELVLSNYVDNVIYCIPVHLIELHDMMAG